MPERGLLGSGARSAVSVRPLWIAPVGVGCLSALVSVVHALLGPGFVLDDWFTLRNAAFDGAWASAGTAQQTARPGAAALYAVVFGLIGPHPLVVLAVLAAVGALTAALLVVLLRSFFPESIAIGAAALWVVLPNHLSLEVWASTVNIAVSVLLTVSAGVVMLRRDVRWAAVPLFVAAALCYEAVIPLAAALVVVGPWRARGRIDWPLVAATGAGLGGVAFWIIGHWHPDKHVSSTTADLTQAFGAHLGWGIAPGGALASALLMVGLLGTVVALGRLLLPSWRSSTGPAEQAVLAGVGVIVLGVVPFARYTYAPLGAGDRFNFVSSVGGALVWTGILVLAWSLRRVVSVVVLAVLISGALVARGQRSILWHRAAHDAVAIQEAAIRSVPRPDGAVFVGPEPIQQQNVAAYLDQSNIAAALQLAYGDPAQRAVLTFSQEEFDRAPVGSRVDIRPVSTLRPDTVVRPD